MKKNKLMMALVLSAGMMFGACGSKETKEAATEMPTEAETVINTTHAYICPMDCENSARMEPGSCIGCGMDLVANPNYVTAGEEGMQEGKSDGHGHDHDDHEGHNH